MLRFGLFQAELGIRNFPRGWARIAELVALEIADLSFEPDLEGVVLTIRHSKTDREGAGATVAVPLVSGWVKRRVFGEVIWL